MTQLVDTAHAQLVALWLGFMGWILNAVTLGIIQWRVWHVAPGSDISSDVAWVGIWRACFYSHTLVTPEFRIMYCSSIGLAEDFTPPEIAAAQVLMVLALLAGLLGSAVCIYALRKVYFDLHKSWPIRSAFMCAGALSLLAAMLSCAPVLWNLHSVLTNQTIHFPREFHMPPAPLSQDVGPGIIVGLVATALMITSGAIFLTYRMPDGPELSRQSQRELRQTVRPRMESQTDKTAMSWMCKDNAAFQSHENL